MPLAPTLVGDGIVLHGLQAEDVGPDYVAWLNDPEVNRFLETRHTSQTHESVVGFVAEKADSGDSFLFGIYVGESGRHVGNIKLGPVRAEHDLAEVSLFIGARDAWGQGIGARAISLVSRFGFEQLSLRKLSASIYAPNIASVRAFKRAGWRQEAVLPAHYLLDDVPVDIIVMGLLAEAGGS